jgi:crossover junction endodeoxyribonuclease RusA
MPIFPVEKPMRVRIDLFLPDKRRRDIDNLSKAILDGCNNIVWKDDTQVCYLRIRKFLDKSAPRVNVEIEWD